MIDDATGSPFDQLLLTPDSFTKAAAEKRLGRADRAMSEHEFEIYTNQTIIPILKQKALSLAAHGCVGFGLKRGEEVHFYNEKAWNEGELDDDHGWTTYQISDSSDVKDEVELGGELQFYSDEGTGGYCCLPIFDSEATSEATLSKLLRKQVANIKAAMMKASVDHTGAPTHDWGSDWVQKKKIEAAREEVPYDEVDLSAAPHTFLSIREMVVDASPSAERDARFIFLPRDGRDPNLGYIRHSRTGYYLQPDRTIPMDIDGNPCLEEDAYEESWYPEVPEGEPDPIKFDDRSVLVLQINQPKTLWCFKKDKHMEEKASKCRFIL